MEMPRAGLCHPFLTPARTQGRQVGLKSVMALAVLLLGLAGCSRHAGSADTQATNNPHAALAWPQVAGAAEVSPPGRVGPVSSMLEGLLARLEANPDDPKGWSLLAQSYAFVGDAAAAEQAITRAVRLGVDEADLRRRVQAAMRPAPQSANWIEQALSK